MSDSIATALEAFHINPTKYVRVDIDHDDSAVGFADNLLTAMEAAVAEGADKDCVGFYHYDDCAQIQYNRPKTHDEIMSEVRLARVRRDRQWARQWARPLSPAVQKIRDARYEMLLAHYGTPETTEVVKPAVPVSPKVVTVILGDYRDPAIETIKTGDYIVFGPTRTAQGLDKWMLIQATGDGDAAIDDMDTADRDTTCAHTTGMSDPCVAYLSGIANALIGASNVVR